MKILSIDSATSACSVAVWADGALRAIERADLARGQAEALMPMIERVLRQANLTFAELDRLAVTVGPGHFTGLRSGLAAARGLALATGLPLIGITTLDAVAAGVPAAERDGAVLVVALDSKRQEAYVQAYASDLTPLSGPQAKRPAEYAAELVRESGSRFVTVGDASAEIALVLEQNRASVLRSSAAPRPDAAVVAALAAKAQAPSAPPAPLYIHPVETTSPRKRVAPG